jgi:hypothetical protein
MSCFGKYSLYFAYAVLRFLSGCWLLSGGFKPEFRQKIGSFVLVGEGRKVFGSANFSRFLRSNAVFFTLIMLVF